MGNILKNKIVVGAMLVSRNSDLLDISIPEMMRWCDWALILADNEDDETVEKILKYQRKYWGRIFYRRSSFPHVIYTAKGDIQDYRRRWRNLDGHVRDEVFMNLKRILEWKKRGYDKIDILILPDADEVFTDYFGELLEKFDASDKLAIKMKPVDVICSMMTIKDRSMSHHVHVLKYRDNYRGWPKVYFAMYKPLRPGDCMRATYYSVHLALLNKDVRKFREENWKRYHATDEPIWFLPKSAIKLSPDEITQILKTKPDSLFSD